MSEHAEPAQLRQRLEDAWHAILSEVPDEILAKYGAAKRPQSPAPEGSTTEKLVAMLRDRHAHGLSKYKVTLDRTDLSFAQWCIHSVEEKLDDAGYTLRMRDEWMATLAENKELREENTRLRAALANSPGACAYCQLPKEQWATCRSSFPGCARADDAMGCPELGARMELDELKARLKEDVEARTP